ncbi:MAG TPA: hypothetical protein VGS99_09015 [Gammaproteobacteria bacterium]|nr:hypothetical protein [Gammaproteobacteria bacterium]
MARILMSWELGAGYGHMAPLISLALPLKAAGHDVTFAVREPATARALLGNHDIPVLEAPANRQVPGNVVLHSYPQILLHTCFNRTEDVMARAAAWREIFARTGAELLISEYSPTAMLAARGSGLKCLATGYGFVVPPDFSPLPNLRPWEDLDTAILARDEVRALDVSNAVLRGLKAPVLDYLGQLYPADSIALCTCRELDNYAGFRGTAEYLGPLLLRGGSQPEWPTGQGQRIFAYLKPFATQTALLDALRDSGQPTLIHAPGLAPELLARYACDKLGFTTALLDIDAVARDCDLAILHGGHGILARVLMAGKPLLLLPLQLEMLINASAVLKLEAGLAAPQLRPAGMRQKLQRLLEEPAFALAAQRFAERYTALDVEGLPLHFLQRVERLLAA